MRKNVEAQKLMRMVDANFNRARLLHHARGRFLRLCPDVLTTDAELTVVADALATIARQR